MRFINKIFVRFARWYAEIHLKRCGFCDLPFDDQEFGVDGAMCDACVDIHAPWSKEVVDPLYLAMMASGAYPYWMNDGHYDFYGEPYNPMWDQPF